MIAGFCFFLSVYVILLFCCVFLGGILDPGAFLCYGFEREVEFWGY